MPDKVHTETQFWRVLDSQWIHTHMDFALPRDYNPKNTPSEYIKRFYRNIDDVLQERYDGVIITWAAVETLEFEEVQYWEWLVEIMKWTRTNVWSTLHVCWWSMAWLYYHHWLGKELYREKLFGIYKQDRVDSTDPLLRSMTWELYIPQARNAGTIKDKYGDDLVRVSWDRDSWATIVSNQDLSQIYINWHLEYRVEDIENEYRRDKAKNPSQWPVQGLEKGFVWKTAGKQFFENWRDICRK